MGTILSIEFNDTLQITREQGFPADDLVWEVHQKTPFTAQGLAGLAFPFKKPGRRVFHKPPVRVFLAQNIGGKWLYWGLVHITGVKYDEDRNETTGKFQFVYVYTPEQMRLAHALIDRNPQTDFFASIAE